MQFLVPAYRLLRQGTIGGVCALGLMWVPAAAQETAVPAPATVPADPDAGVLTPNVRRMIILATQDTDEVLTATVKLAAKAFPGRETEILALVAREAPDRAPTAAFSLGLRPRTAPAAVDAAQGGASLGSVAESAEKAQSPRFFSFEGWDGRVGLSSSRSTGNTEQSALGFDARATRSHGKLSYEFDLDLELESSNGTQTKRLFEAGTQVNYDLSERVFTFLSIEYVDDEFSGFEYQANVSPGIGVRIFDNDDVKWRVEGGPVATFDRVNNTDDLEISAGGRLASRLKWNITKDVVLENNTEVILANNSNLENETALIVPLFKALSLALSYDVRYAFNPPVGTQELDTTTKASLVYSF